MLDMEFVITYEDEDGNIESITAYSKEEAKDVKADLISDGYINIKIETIKV